MANGVKGDMIAHENTYGGFLRLLKFGTIGAFAVAAVVVVIIAS